MSHKQYIYDPVEFDYNNSKFIQNNQMEDNKIKSENMLIEKSFQIMTNFTVHSSRNKGLVLTRPDQCMFEGPLHQHYHTK